MRKRVVVADYETLEDIESQTEEVIGKWVPLQATKVDAQRPRWL